jgi:hypothetical protein
LTRGGGGVKCYHACGAVPLDMLTAQRQHLRHVLC